MDKATSKAEGRAADSVGVADNLVVEIESAPLLHNDRYIVNQNCKFTHNFQAQSVIMEYFRKEQEEQDKEAE